MDLRSRVIRHLDAERPVTAYSGGVDSTLLAWLLRDCGVAVFVDTPFLSDRIRETALRNAEHLGLDVMIKTIHWRDMTEASRNGPDRCYHCKRSIYGCITEAMEGLGGDMCVDGENADDDGDGRPGRKAAMEFEIRSPFRELGIGRAIIEDELKKLDLPHPVIKDTCMATRIPVGNELNENILRFIESLEHRVRGITGVRQLRVRLDGDAAAIFTSPDEICLFDRFHDELNDMFLCEGLKMSVDRIGYP